MGVYAYVGEPEHLAPLSADRGGLHRERERMLLRRLLVAGRRRRRSIGIALHECRVAIVVRDPQVVLDGHPGGECGGWDLSAVVLVVADRGCEDQRDGGPVGVSR